MKNKKMASSPRSFPVDIFALKEYGIKKWQDEFFWPVSDRDFIALCRDIERCVINQINTQPIEMSDLLLVQGTLRGEYQQFLHAVKVLEQVKSRGLEVLFSDKTLWYKHLMTGNLPTAYGFSKKKDAYNNPYADSLVKKIKGKMKGHIKSLVCNKQKLGIKLVNAVGQGKISARLCGSTSSLIKQYIGNLPYWVSATYPWDWLPKDVSYKVPDRLKDSIENVSSTMVDELKSIANKNEIMLLDDHIDHLRQLTKSKLIDAAQILHLIKNKIKGKNKIHLLISDLGNPFHKALCIAGRQEGWKVTSFTHGGFTGFYDSPTFAFSEFALSDEFITYTPESIKLLEKIKNNYKPLRNNKVAIRSGDSYEYLKLWRKYGHKPLSKGIERVMLIGFPHNQWRKPQGTFSLPFMHLDLELRIVDLLGKAGYNVTYKVHPDRILEVEGVFESRAKVLTKGLFQDYLDSVDAFIFGSIRTTAFPIALCTNKPIIGFIREQEPYKPSPEAIELLKKRCHMIYAKFDERNRVIFDEKEFLEALSVKPEEPNNEFFEKYYIP
ncbi:MAG: hypothetical protein AB1797_05100 [bacterium]